MGRVVPMPGIEGGVMSDQPLASTTTAEENRASLSERDESDRANLSRRDESDRASLSNRDELDRVSVGQRKINLMWETTQAIIAISVVETTLLVVSLLIVTPLFKPVTDAAATAAITGLV